MDRLEAMSTLVAAVDAGSLSKAARRSGVPLATVSRRMAQLEVLSYQAARAESEGRLVRVLKLYESTPTPVNILYSGQGPLPLKLRAFLDFVAPRIKAKLALAAATEAVA